ncbi:MAG: type II toxin-antitoxin system VapC family toxin [Verrucomicrobia bacterium]|nr:type II toxin-antitoxin system VapC family toxin [Verrucomicrobiota bacterium]MCH8527949.1 type II toxin-antitoxin system VapC family toxin [Kiritimatiellia bacterium]
MKLFDTNILIYSFDLASSFHTWSKQKLSEGIIKREAFVNPIILAELAVGDENPFTLTKRLQGLGIQLMDLPWESADVAASAFAEYLNARSLSGPIPTTKIPLPDFFIGAHAQVLSCPIVTADVSRYQTYFPSVELIQPN